MLPFRGLVADLDSAAARAQANSGGISMPYGADHGFKDKETNNYEGGKSGSKVKINMGPATGARHKNPSEKGGVFRATKGKGV